MKRVWEKMNDRRALQNGIGAALQQIFEEDQSADRTMEEMIAKLDRLSKEGKLP